MKSRWAAVTAVLFIMLIFTVLIITAKKNSEKYLLSSSDTVADSRKTVIIDAGHGGEDGGAVVGDVMEKNINLAISKKLEKALTLMGFNVIMTRTEDKLLYGTDSKTMRQKKVADIRYRTDLVNSTPNAVLISIHQNKFTDSKYYGTQVFYSHNTEESKTIAKTIQDTVKILLQPDNNRKIKKSGSNIYLLYHSQKPAVMVECGFLSNKNECAKLLCDDYQNKLVFCIMCGIIDSLYVQEE